MTDYRKEAERLLDEFYLHVSATVASALADEWAEVQAAQTRSVHTRAALLAHIQRGRVCLCKETLDAAPAAPSAQCLTCNGHGVIGGLLPAGGGYESHPCPDCAAPAAPDPSGWSQPEVRALATPEEMQRGYHVLRTVVTALRETVNYRDEEGEDTDALADLADRLGKPSAVPTVRIGNAKVAVFDEAYVADLAEKTATVPAEVPMPKPVAFGVLNTAPTGSPHRLMMVRIDIPSDDQYGGALWMPLVFAEDAQHYGDAREAAGYAQGMEQAAVIAWMHYMDKCRAMNTPAAAMESWCAAGAIRAAQKGGE